MNAIMTAWQCGVSQTNVVPKEPERVGAMSPGWEPTGCPIAGMTDISQAGTAGVTDNPITRASEDLLQRGDVAAALAENLRYVDAWKGHVVGVLGPWGSGKTSLVNLVRERLAVAPELPVLDFTLCPALSGLEDTGQPALARHP
jgi:hypothetical protein